MLATGRSTFGITRVLEMLGLPREGGEQVLTVASNGSVTFSYPPVEVLTTVTFDASEVVRMLLEHVPNALVAVEEIGVGYRVNRHFPDGEITGEMKLQSVEELVAEPVTRVIIRDPHASEQDFVELAEKVGLHGINYFIGWTAWLDLAPTGVSKASGLDLGVRAARRRGGDVLAIGDGRNDIEMLAVGRPRRGDGPGAARGAGGGGLRDLDRAGRRALRQELERWFPA